MLLAEDLLLLITDDESGKPRLDATRLDLVLAGALLLELAERGRVDISGPGKPVRPGRIVVRDPSPTDDAVLDDALRRIAQRKPSKPQDLLSKLAKGLRPALFGRLVASGVLRSDERQALGLFPVRRWPAADPSHEDAVRRGLADVLGVGRTPTTREAALISLLQAVDQVPKVVTGTGLDKRELKRRAKAVAQGEFAGAAVRKAIESINAAVMGAVVAASVAGAAGSSG